MKIGFSNIGGIYIGEDIQTDDHVHHAITIAVCFSGNFRVWCEQQTVSCPGIIIQPHTSRKFASLGNSDVAFIHIEPFSQEGLQLTDRIEPFRQLTNLQLKNTLKCLSEWCLYYENKENLTAETITRITSRIGTIEKNKIDVRIQKAMYLIRRTEGISLEKAAAEVNLSTYRFSHLFKQEAGMSFKKFVLYRKLVKALGEISQNQSLTYSSYSGGFADQAHFTRTYYKAFGILPSHSVK